MLSQVRGRHLVGAALTMALAVMHRRATVARGDVSHWQVMIDFLFDPYQLVFLVLPVGLLTALGVARHADAPETLLRRGNHVRAGSGAARDLAGAILPAVAWMVGLSLVIGVDLPGGVVPVSVGALPGSAGLAVVGGVGHRRGPAGDRVGWVGDTGPASTRGTAEGALDVVGAGARRHHRDGHRS